MCWLFYDNDQLNYHEEHKYGHTDIASQEGHDVSGTLVYDSFFLTCVFIVDKAFKL